MDMSFIKILAVLLNFDYTFKFCIIQNKEMKRLFKASALKSLKNLLRFSDQIRNFFRFKARNLLHLEPLF